MRLPDVSPNKTRYELPVWPLWYQLPEPVQVALTYYQLREHKRKLRPPTRPDAKPITKNIELESGDEIDKIMRTNKEVGR